MTLAEAQAAAGVRFGGAADGAFYPTTLPAGYPHLFVDLGPNGTVTCIGAQIGDAPTILQNITTSAGVRLGDTASRLLAIYGTVARHLDAPPSGIAPRAGYVVTQPQGNLAFSVRPTGDRITGIYAGDHNLTPSTCNG